MMNKIATLPYNGYIVEIYDYEDGKYSFELLDSNREFLCKIALYSLKRKYQFDNGNLMHNQHDQFSDKDYYQEDMGAVVKQIGYCSTLQDFLINNSKKLPIEIDNIYSSLLNMILEEGIKFWDSQVKKGKAEYVVSLIRYRLIIQLLE